LLPGALEAMTRAAREAWANPSSLHGPGRAARKIVEEARERVAALAGCHPEEIVFTGGGTEACNAALRGFAARHAAPAHLAVSGVEHPAVKATARGLEAEGWQISWIAPDADGTVRPERVAGALRPDTVLCAVMAANNEVGTVQPAAEIGALLRERKVAYFCDAVQALGKISVRFQDWGVDLAALSAHKIGGPKGVGALIVRKGLSFEPQIRGGGQERGRRGGTENVPGIAGFGAAAAWWTEHGNGERERLRELRVSLESALMEKIPGLEVNATGAQRLPNTLHVTFPGCRGDVLVMALDLAGVALSAGSACASGSVKPSEVLLAMGRNPEQAISSLRISLGFGNGSEEIPAVAEAVATAYRNAKSG
jgi:cysteine desulfurase